MRFDEVHSVVLSIPRTGTQKCSNQSTTSQLNRQFPLHPPPAPPPPTHTHTHNPRTPPIPPHPPHTPYSLPHSLDKKGVDSRSDGSCVSSGSRAKTNLAMTAFSRHRASYCGRFASPWAPLLPSIARRPGNALSCHADSVGPPRAGPTGGTRTTALGERVPGMHAWPASFALDGVARCCLKL